MKPTTLRVRRLAAGCALMMLIALAALAPSAARAGAPKSAQVATHARRLDVLAGGRAAIRGALRPAIAGRTVTLQVLRGERWIIVDHARTDAAGRFTLGIRGSQPGSRRVRVRFAGDFLSGPVTREVGRLNIYRRAAVSWYGPGLYGSRLACGGTLSRGDAGRRQQVAALRLARDAALPGPEASGCRSSTAAPSWAAASTTSPPPPPSGWASTPPGRSGRPADGTRGATEAPLALPSGAGASVVRSWTSRSVASSATWTSTPSTRASSCCAVPSCGASRSSSPAAARGRW